MLVSHLFFSHNRKKSAPRRWPTSHRQAHESNKIANPLGFVKVVKFVFIPFVTNPLKRVAGVV